MEGTQTAQDMMKAQPQKEHQWLEKLVGEWTYEGEAAMGPGKPVEKFTGTESVRSIGGLWFVAEGHGTMPGGDEATTVLTLGYSPQKEKYVGTWIGSMMAHMWVYEGELDEAERSLALDTEGPSMEEEGKLANYRETIEFKNDDQRVFTSSVRGDDGSWQQLMSANYKRKK